MPLLEDASYQLSTRVNFKHLKIKPNFLSLQKPHISLAPSISLCVSSSSLDNGEDEEKGSKEEAEGRVPIFLPAGTAAKGETRASH